MDFTEWTAEDPVRFAKTINFLLCALTNKDMRECATEGEKTAENAEKAAKEGEEDVKKKSCLTWITRLFRHS